MALNLFRPFPFPRAANRNALICLTLLVLRAFIYTFQPFAAPAQGSTDVTACTRQAHPSGLVKNLRRGVATSPFTIQSGISIHHVQCACIIRLYENFILNKPAFTRTSKDCSFNLASLTLFVNFAAELAFDRSKNYVWESSLHNMETFEVGHVRVLWHS